MSRTRASAQQNPRRDAHPHHLISDQKRRKNEPSKTEEAVPVPQHRPGELFVKGPIPQGWIDGASRCRGKALNVGIAIWQLAQMKKSGRVSISLTRVSSRMGFDRTTASRALHSLEMAGLIVIEQHPGRRLVVTLCWPPVTEPGLPI